MSLPIHVNQRVSSYACPCRADPVVLGILICGLYFCVLSDWFQICLKLKTW